MYVDADFVLALVKEDDWLAEPAEELYEAHREELWTSPQTLVELLLVAYRENLDAERVLANAKAIVEVRGDIEPVLAAASHVEHNDLTPFDALHLVHSGSDPIVSSDGSYDGLSERVPLEPDE